MFEKTRKTGMMGVFCLCLVWIMLLAVGPPGALAQEEVEEATEAEEEMEAKEGVPQVAEEITVTSRRREENVQEVPVAVSVVTGETLEDIRAKDISLLQDYAPNLSIYPGRNQSTTMTAFIRGIGQADPLWGVDPGVGLYVDDVYVARPQGALLDVFDVERVEVLRGPQGTLYGKNTIGGAIKYVSRRPTDQLDARISLTAGQYSTADLRASVSGPLVEGKLRGSLAFASLNHDGFGTNLYQNRDVSDKKTLAYRAALDWLPAENVSVRFSFDGSKDDAEPKGLTRMEANPFCWLFLGQACPPNENLFDTQSGLEPANSTDSQGYSLYVGWDINSEWRFNSITAYRETDTVNNIDFDTTPAPITDVYADYFDDQLSQEFQAIYNGGGKLSGVMGLYYFDGFAGGLVRNNFLGSIFGTTDGTTDTKSFALYGDGTYSLTDSLNLNLGLRLTREEKRGRAFNAGYTDDSFTEITIVTADYDKTVTFDTFAPRIGLDYFFNPDVMGYATVSWGHKSGGFNVRAQSTFFPESAEPFDDEKLTMGEIGVKSVLANRQLMLNAAFFYGDYTDIQVSTFTSFDSDGDGVDDSFYGDFLNAGDSINKGVEVEFNWTPQGWFGLSGWVAYLSAEPTEFLDENGDTFVDTQVITNAPKYTGTVNANFNFPISRGLISGSVGYSYRDDSVLTNEGGPDPRDPTQPLLPIIQEAYGLWNAWIGWFSPQGNWKFTVNAINISNEEYLQTGYNIPVLGLLQGSYGQPSTVTATLGWSL